MKRTLILCLLLACCGIAFSQSYDSAIRYRLSPSFNVAVDTLIARAITASPADTGEGSESMELTRFKSFMGSRISYDVSPGADMFGPMGAALSAYSSFIGSCPSSGNWQPLGPSTSYYGTTDVEHQGRINAIWMNPISGTLLAGADGGGLWRSYDDGLHWNNVTDGTGGGSNILGMPGVNGLDVNPLDTNTIYINLSVTNQYTKSVGYHLGLAYSTDDGATWHADIAFTDTVNAFDPTSGNTPQVDKIAYMPGTHKLFAFYHSVGVFYKDGPSDTWHNITPPGMTSGQPAAGGMDFSIASPGKAVFTTHAVGYPLSWADTSMMWVCERGIISKGKLVVVP